MFGNNEIVGQKFFKELSDDSLVTTSVFTTLQGEGPFSGRLSVFVRLSKCNLNCHFCDTYFDEGDVISFDNLIALMQDSISSKTTIPHSDVGVVITGGEPLLQKNIVPFISKIKNTFKSFIQIESNGIIFQELPSCSLVISPKINEKTMNYIHPSKKNLEIACALKFVISDKSPYNSIPTWAFEWKEKTGRPIYISPMNTYEKLPVKTKNSSLKERSDYDEVISFWEEGLMNKFQNQKNHEYAGQFCIKNGCILNLQQHLYTGIA